MNTVSRRPRSIHVLAALLAAGSLAPLASAQVDVARDTPAPARSADSFGIAGRTLGAAPVAPQTDPDRPAADQAGNGPGGGGVTDIGVQTIDFEGLAHDDASVAQHGDYYIEDSWVVQQDSGLAWELSTFGTEESRWPGSTAMFNRNIDATTYLFPYSGAFTLVSVDVANLNGNGPTSVTFIGHRLDGTTVSRTCTTTQTANRLDTFFFGGFNNLAYVEWIQDSPYHQFDNIRVSRAPVVLDFEGLAHDDAGSTDHGSYVYEDGFDITQGDNEPFGFNTFGTQSIRYAGSTALFNNSANGLITVVASGGGGFNVHSIDLANLNDNGPTSVTFVGHRENNGTITQTFTLPDGPNFLENFQFKGFTNITSLTWTQDTPYHQFDNVVLSRGQAVMDFGKLSEADDQAHGWGNDYREDGFTLHTGSTLGYYSFGVDHAKWIGSTALFDNGPGEWDTRLEAIDNAPFGIVSINLAALNANDQVSVTFRGTKPNGNTVDHTVNVSDDGHRFQTVQFPAAFRQLSSLDWSQESPYHQFDAITLVSTTTRLIDFQVLEHDGDGSVGVGEIYAEDGFKLTKGQNEAFDFFVYGTNANSYPGSTAMFNNTVDGLARLSTVSGRDFDLLQMDISRLGNSGADGSVAFVGHKTDGSTVQQTFTYYGPSVGLQTVEFRGFDSLEYVEWTQSSPFHQFDNIAVVEGAGEDCYADCDGNGALDLFDFLCFVNAFNANDAYSNCDGNGDLDLFDFLCYVNAFNAGC